jgi:membrane-bound metal-dependent hydrolase YbcI (DUF457 family)
MSPHIKRAIPRRDGTSNVVSGDISAEYRVVTAFSIPGLVNWASRSTLGSSVRNVELHAEPHGMKGITHFLTGVALGTCFPEVIALAREGSLLPILGGVGGLLPDVLDFRFVRYFETYQVEIDPAPFVVSGAATAGGAPVLCGRAGAAFVADEFAGAMHTAYVSGEPCNVVVHTLRLGHDLWRRYSIRLDPEARVIAVCFGPLVTTGGVTYPGTELPDSVWVERALDMPIVHTYSHEYHIDAFTGPSFRFARERAGPEHPEEQGDVLAIHFLDWHHRWTHSLPLALAVGLASGGLATLVWGVRVGGWAGMLMAIGFAGHVLEDQLGHMGSNLFWPFTWRRLPGAKLVHAGEAIPNFLTTWTALTLILYNLDRWGAGSRLGQFYLPCVIVLPWLVLGTLYVARRRKAGATLSTAGQGPAIEAERLAEVQGVGDG